MPAGGQLFAGYKSAISRERCGVADADLRVREIERAAETLVHVHTRRQRTTLFSAGQRRRENHGDVSKDLEPAYLQIQGPPYFAASRVLGTPLPAGAIQGANQ